jgi:methionyl-tRNA formyltransferase
MGVQALLEAADLVASGKAMEHPQDEAHAGYEGWMHDEEAQVHWALHVDVIYNLVRACNPSPGAWTHFGAAKARIYEVRRTLVKTHGEVMGPPGTIASIDEERGITVNAHGGRIEIHVIRPEGGAKVKAAEFARQQGLAVGQKLGVAPV